MKDIILDVDTGIDDALALMLASWRREDFNILGMGELDVTAGMCPERRWPKRAPPSSSLGPPASVRAR